MIDVLKIELTDEQIAMLKPLFQCVADANNRDYKAAIAAQIWPDGMVVRLLLREHCEALAKALGGRPDMTHDSAHDRMKNHD